MGIQSQYLGLNKALLPFKIARSADAKLLQLFKNIFSAQDDDIDIEEEIDLDDPVVADDDQLFGVALLHDQYLTNSDSDKELQDEEDEGLNRMGWLWVRNVLWQNIWIGQT